MTGGIFFSKNKRLNQIESTRTGDIPLFLLLQVFGEKKRQFEGGARELKSTTTTHKTAAFTIVHVDQYTSY